MVAEAGHHGDQVADVIERAHGGLFVGPLNTAGAQLTSLRSSRTAGPRSGRSQGLHQGFDIPGVIMPETVNKERRRAVDTARDAAQEILPNARGVCVGTKRILKVLAIKPEGLGVLDEVRVVQRGLMLEESIVHFPESLLACGRFRGLGGVLGVWMELAERKISEHKPQPGTEPALDLFDNRVGSAAVRAFVIAVLDQGQNGIGRSLRMIPIRHRNA